MKSSRTRKAISLPLILLIIVAGTLTLSFLFYSFWQKLNTKVEHILKEQFNQQQLVLARKIADNVETYIDFLENALMGYAGLFQTTPDEISGLKVALQERFDRHKHFGVLELRRYDNDGVLVQAFSSTPAPPQPYSLKLPDQYLQWIRNPAHRGKLLLGKTFVSAESNWQGQRVMRFLTPLYWPGPNPRLAGSLEMLIDPFFISQKVTEGVRSGATGYAWIIDQDEIILAHYEKDFVGQESIPVRLVRNPKIIFRGLRELHDDLLQGKEGVTEYDSGWHRQRLGQMPKLAAYTTIRFDKGLIRGITAVEDPVRNLWGVAVVAPIEEVAGQVGEVLHQELFLVGMFFLVVLLGGLAFATLAFIWNKTLAREVSLKTKELLESHELLVRSERFAAVGEAAAYVSHEIKNPLMVIGGLAQQVGRRLESEPELQEKLNIIRGEVRRLETFLGDLRDFTRPALPTKERIDLNQIIHEVHTLMDGEAQKRHIAISEYLDPKLPSLEADPGQMKQVLLNLIKNSLEAMDSGGEITLESGVEGPFVWFSVRDTGSGMPPEVLDKIFDPFFTTKEKGTGLGLAVIHKIILDHHGTVAVESEPDKGAAFTVKLQCVD